MMRPIRQRLLARGYLFVLGLATASLVGHAPVSAHVFTVHDLGPGDPWCDFIQHTVASGDVIRLAAGDYPGDCFVLKSGIVEEGEPLAIVAAGDGPVRLIGRAGRPVVTVFGSYVRFGGLTFVPAEDQPAILARGGSLLVDGCVFAGGAVGVDTTDARGGLSLIDNLFEDVAAPVRAGCADAPACDKTRAVLRDNVFRSRSARAGVAVEVVGPNEVLAADNVFEGRWEVALDAIGPANIAQNVVLGGGVGLRVRSGVLANNAIVGTTRLAVDVVPDARWPRAVDLVGNTVIAARGEVWTPGADLGAVVGNALAGPSAPALPATGGVFCADASACWVDPEAGDLRPRAEGPLTDGGPGPAEATRDICRALRRHDNAAGAVAASDGPPMRLQPVSKLASACFAADYIDPALAARPAAPPPAAGCASGSRPFTSAPLLFWALLAIGLTAAANLATNAAPRSRDQ